MNTKKLLNLALSGIDSLGYRLDQFGITGKVNRHNIAALVMLEQKHLEGEWDSIQARIDLRRSQVEHLASAVESRTDAVLGPVFGMLRQLRSSH